MLSEQQRATLCVRSIKKWNSQLIQIRHEITATGIFSPDAEDNTELIECASELSEMKIGKYVQERMRLLEKANLMFSDEESVQLMDKEWSKRVLHLSKPFMQPYDSYKTPREQIADESGNNRYWSNSFSFNGRPVFICSQWFYSNKKYFDAWISPLAEQVGITFPERTVIVDAPENRRHVHKKYPAAPMQEQKIGNYVQKCLRELETMGIGFQKDYLALMLTDEWTRENFKIGIPFLKIVDTRQPVRAQIVDKKKKNRYWNKSFTFGDVHVFVCNEWHEYSQDLFEKWLKTVPLHIVTTQDEFPTDDISENVVKLTITDYKIRKHH